MPAFDARLRGHVRPLDGVRGIAISLVLIVHLLAVVKPTNGVERAIKAASSYGMLGVDLFFVLSGFLITGILVEAKGSEGFFRNFYMRRALRIFPLYYGVLALLFWVAPLIPALRGPELEFLVAHQAWAWLYGVNVFDALHGGPSLSYLSHFWSLAVEEHFYFFWPLLLWAVPRSKLLPVSAGVALTSLSLRIVGAAMGLHFTTLYELTPFRLDQLAFGGFLAIAAREPGGLDKVARVLRRAAPVAAVAVVALFAIDKATGLHLSEPIHAVRTAMWTVLFGALVVAAVTLDAGNPLARFLRSSTMVSLGKYSYGLYVFHHFFSMYFEIHDTEGAIAERVGSHTIAGILVVALGLSLSTVASFLSFQLFEKRFLEMKRRWPSKRAGLEGAPSASAEEVDSPGAPV